MENRTVLFDISKANFNWIELIIMLFALALSSYVLFKLIIKKEKPKTIEFYSNRLFFNFSHPLYKSINKQIYKIMTGIVIILTLLVIFGLVWNYFLYNRIIREHQYRIWEGNVEVIDPFFTGENKNNELIINGKVFNYTNFMATDPFMNAGKYKGKIQVNDYVYVKYYKQDILFLEVKDSD